MRNIFRGKSQKECRYEHAVLNARIDDLCGEIRILKCDGHIWEDTDNPLYHAVVQVRCVKCGGVRTMLADDWREIQIAQKRAEIDHLEGKSPVAEEKPETAP
jgi:hypothetical protein